MKVQKSSIDNKFNNIINEINIENKWDKIVLIKQAIIKDSMSLIERFQKNEMEEKEIYRLMENRLTQIDPALVNVIHPEITRIQTIALALTNKKLDPYKNIQLNSSSDLEIIRSIRDSDLKAYVMAYLYNNQNTKVDFNIFDEKEMIAMSPYLLNINVSGKERWDLEKIDRIFNICPNLVELLAKNQIDDNTEFKQLIDKHLKKNNFFEEKNELASIEANPEYKLSEVKQAMFDGKPVLQKISSQMLFDYMPPGAGEFVNALQEIEMINDYGKMFCQARKEGKIDIYKTHLSFLALCIEHNFKNLFSSEVISSFDQDRLNTLELFRSEMHNKINNKEVTYEWWMQFNMRLSILVTDPENRSDYTTSYRTNSARELLKNDNWKTEKGTREALFSVESNKLPSRFRLSPDSTIGLSDRFIYPSCLGDIDLDPFNKTLSSDSWFIGLIKQPILADGQLMWPDQFFRHDIAHLNFFREGLNDLQIIKEDLELIDRKYNVICQNLNTLGEEYNDLAQLLKIIYFLIWHERQGLIGDLKDCAINDSNVLDRLSEQFRSSFSNFEEMGRSDWYLDHLPLPEKMGFKSAKEMLIYGAMSMQIFFESKSLNDALGKIAALKQGHAAERDEEVKEEDLEEKVIPFTIQPNPALANGQTLHINQLDLNFYNRIVKAINSPNSTPLNDVCEMAKQNEIVYNILVMQGIPFKK